MKRRQLLKQAVGLAVGVAASAYPGRALPLGEVKRHGGTRIKIALNAYSFNRPLMAGAMTLSDVVDYCASQNLDALDATGYYFPGYPNAPEDESVFASLHEPAGRDRQLQAHRQAGDDLADGHFGHARARRRHVDARGQEGGRGLLALGR
jgi:hypothetical protein